MVVTSVPFRNPEATPRETWNATSSGVKDGISGGWDAPTSGSVDAQWRTLYIRLVFRLIAALFSRLPEGYGEWSVGCRYARGIAELVLACISDGSLGQARVGGQWRAESPMRTAFAGGASRL